MNDDSDDIIGRLRDEGSKLNAEAADEIERLRKEALGPSFAWDGYLVSGLGKSLDEVYRLVLDAKQDPQMRAAVKRLQARAEARALLLAAGEPQEPRS
jgi:hypothetical protein